MYFFVLVLFFSLSLFGSDIEQNNLVSVYEYNHDTFEAVLVEMNYNINSNILFNDLKKLHPSRSSFTSNKNDNQPFLPVLASEIEALDICLSQNNNELEELVIAWEIADKLALTTENSSMNQLTQKILGSNDQDKNLLLKNDNDCREILTTILRQNYLSYLGNIQTMLIRHAKTVDTSFRSVFLKTIGMPLAIITSPFYFSIKMQQQMDDSQRTKKFYSDIENSVNNSRLFKMFHFASGNKITTKFLGLSFFCFFFIIFNRIRDNRIPGMEYGKKTIILDILVLSKWFIKNFITNHTNIPQNLFYSIGLYGGYKLFSYFMRKPKNDWDIEFDNKHLKKEEENDTTNQQTKNILNERRRCEVWKNENQKLYSYEKENNHYARQNENSNVIIKLPDHCVACFKISDNLFILGDATQNEKQQQIPVNRSQYKYPITTLWLGEKVDNTIEKRQKLWEPLVDDLSPNIAPIIRTGNWKPYIDTVKTRVDESGRLWLYASTLCGEEFYFPLTPTDDPLQFQKENIEYYKKVKFLKEAIFFTLFWSACHFVHIPTVTQKFLLLFNQLLQKIKRNSA